MNQVLPARGTPYALPSLPVTVCSIVVLPSVCRLSCAMLGSLTCPMAPASSSVPSWSLANVYTSAATVGSCLAMAAASAEATT